MQTLKLVAALAAIAVSLSTAARAEPGNCGEYMYWKGGKCVDARNAPAVSWPDQMARKNVW